MKALILSAALLAVTPATAKTWVDETCERTVISANDTFVLLDPDGYHLCHVEYWPPDQPFAVMACTDGIEFTMTPHDDKSMEFAGREMSVYDGPLPCGHSQ